jgi:YD repeat-containing protein
MSKLHWIAFTVGSVLFTSSQMTASAQGCFTYSDNYGVYLSVSGDQTNIYTSVLVDGQGTMNITGGQGCSGINWGNAQHTPQAVNVIADPNGNHVGGQQSGTNECPDCYVSEQNNQSMAYDQSGNTTSYTFTWNGSVYCNFGGTIFGSGGIFGIGIHQTNWLIPKNGYDPISNSCTGNLMCPNGNQHAVCGQTPGRQHILLIGPTECSYNYAWDWEINYGSTCYPIGKSGLTFTPNTCD